MPTEEEIRRRCIISPAQCPPDMNQAQALAIELALADGATAADAADYLSQAENLLAAGFGFSES